jgi:hypothetical protein
MNSTRSKSPHSSVRIIVIIVFTVIFVCSVIIYEPTIFKLHATIKDQGNGITGLAFKNGESLFLVNLSTGPQLTVDLREQKVYLASKIGASGFRFGKYLLLSKRQLRGIDLSVSEGFNRQRPVVEHGTLRFKDPLSPNGSVAFQL